MFYDEGSTGDDSCQGEYFGSDWCDAGGEVATDEALVDGEIIIATEEDHFYFGFLKWLLLGKKD